MDSEQLAINKEMLKNITRVSEDATKIIQSALSPLFAEINKIQKAISISIPKIQFPVFPKVNWEDVFISFSEECKSNAKYGWSISSCMSFSSYRTIGRSEDRQEIRDSLFVNLFEANDYELLKKEKRFILSTSYDGWKEFYEECFNAIEKGLYKVVIPSLISAVEHEMAANFDSNAIGKRLVKSAQSAIEGNNDQNSFTYIIGMSVVSLLENGIFRGTDFNQQRDPLINRNRVMHGRDNPKEWDVIDIYKLITIISTLKMIKD